MQFYFLLVINSNLALSLSVFEIQPLLKLSIKNCGQTAANENMITTDSLREVASALSDSTITDPLRLTI